MIFKQHLIDMILSGQKTQTRRPNRGYYVVGKTYAIQPCRTCKGIPGRRIVMDAIWEEVGYERFQKNFYEKPADAKLMPITQVEAESEGFSSWFSFEEAFRKLYPNWNKERRWAYKFHVVEAINENK